jgi:hypothetical protein
MHKYLQPEHYCLLAARRKPNMKSNYIRLIPNGSSERQIDTVGEHPKKLKIDARAREWLNDWLPEKIRLIQDSPDGHVNSWLPGRDYVIPSTKIADSTMLAVTLVEEFVRAGGHVIWIGVTDDLYRMSLQLMFKIAGLELPAEDADVYLDVGGYLRLKDAHAQMLEMWIDFCNVEDCGDLALEHDFVASMTSFKPTLIVVDFSIFDQMALDPFEALVRQTYGRHMVKELRSTNPLSSVLWPSTAPSDAFAT